MRAQNALREPPIHSARTSHACAQWKHGIPADGLRSLCGHPFFSPGKQPPTGAVMRAIRFETFGDPSVLEMADVADPATDETPVLVRVMAASINPSDAKNVA